MDERRDQDDMDGIAECVDEMESGRCVIVSSVEIFGEVLSEEVGEEARRRLDEVCMNPGIQIVDKDGPIARLAGEIRNHYQKQKKIDGKRTITQTDAAHLATAINCEVDEFHTFDDGKQESRKGRSLLALSGNVAGHKLRICRPRGVQRVLRLDDPASGKAEK
jgi:hypothetical protein